MSFRGILLYLGYISEPVLFLLSFLSVLLLEKRLCVLLPPLVETELNQINLGSSARIFTRNEMRNTQSTFEIVPVLEQMHSVTFDP